MKLTNQYGLLLDERGEVVGVVPGGHRGDGAEDIAATIANHTSAYPELVAMLEAWMFHADGDLTDLEDRTFALLAKLGEVEA